MPRRSPPRSGTPTPCLRTNCRVRSGRPEWTGDTPPTRRTLAHGGLPLRNARDLLPLAAVPLDAISPGTFLIHLRDAGEECPRPVRGTPRIAAGPPVTRALATGRTTSAPAAGNPSSGKLRRNRRRACADEKRSQPKEGGRSEGKRSRAGSPHGEPRTEPPSEAAERRPPASRGPPQHLYRQPP